MATPQQPSGDVAPANVSAPSNAPSNAPSAAPGDTAPKGSVDDRDKKTGRYVNKWNDKRGEKRKRGGGRGDSRGGDFPSRKDRGRQINESKRRNLGFQGPADNVAAGADGQPAQSRMVIPFSAEEIAAEERRPKRKVAVMIGYAGTGYKGMQINHNEKTIEGDLFAAFVAAGAIAKTNADDPKKSSFVRCARTDKGVHAAGNVISLKLIVEDPDIIQKINEKLPDQIRIWGIQRTNNAFNCYQSCDSRFYEYLLPSYSLLPPHPQSFLGKKVIEAAKEKGVYEDCEKLWADVKDFWDEVDKNDIQPILDRCDPGTREEVLKQLHVSETSDGEPQVPIKSEDVPSEAPAEKEGPMKVEVEMNDKVSKPDTAILDADSKQFTTEQTEAPLTEAPKPRRELTPVELAMRDIKAAYVAAKRRYRVTPGRLEQLQSALDLYNGTNNFHNYTIQKTFKDPSAKRHIKSFKVNTNPIQIGDTEWLSLKVHGQSFMMHQIRKMVAMAVLCVRCAAPFSRITESYGPGRISIPKAPGLGLLLERPVFESYNKKIEGSPDRMPIDFTNYDKEMQEFKDREIYKRMFETEESENSFHTFFHQLDNFHTDFFLWVTAHGLEAAYERKERGEGIPLALQAELGDEGEDAGGGEGREG